MTKKNELKKIQIIVPIYIKLSKNPDGKKYRINLNNFNKRKGFGYNNIKKKFYEEIKDQLTFQAKYIEQMNFQINYGNNRRVDRDNYTSAIRKFFQDSLVTSGCIDDDVDSMIHHYSDQTMTREKGIYKCYINIVYKLKT